MTRVLFYIAVVFALAAGFAWLADRPGALVLNWQGYRIETSLMFAAVAIAVAVGAIMLLGAAVRAIVLTPRRVGEFLGARRRDRGYRALSRGVIAVGAGDSKTAKRAANESTALLGKEPLTLLLTAQAAQLAGDGDGARTAFEALAALRETRVLGLHGLFVEARRQGEHKAARHFAEEASQAAPKTGWAGTALFEYQAQAGDWLGALRTLGSNTDAKLVDKTTSRRLRAVLLTAWALEIESGKPDEARNHALEARRLAPDLTEAAVVAGRLQARAGDVKRAARTLEAAWKVMPHPEIADSYTQIRSGDSVSDRLKRMRRLAEIRAHHAEGAMAVARAAIDALEWSAAREALEGLVQSEPSERVCLLMAEIEDGENGDEGRVRAWLTRAIHAPRDPAWIADGEVFARWAPISPMSGRIDAFEWKVASQPPPQLRVPEIEVETELDPSRDNRPDGDNASQSSPVEIVEIGYIPPSSPQDEKSNAPDSVRPLKENAEPASPAASDLVIPRAPDDPGPEPVDDGDKRPGFGLS
jgi:HemY protein